MATLVIEVTDSRRQMIRARAASRGPIRRYFLRNPEMKSAAKRAALVGAVGAGLAFLGTRNVWRGRRAMQAYHTARSAARAAKAMPRHGHYARSLSRMATRTPEALKQDALRHFSRNYGLKGGGIALALVGVPWAAMPVGDAMGVREVIRAGHRRPPVPVFIRQSHRRHV